MKKRLAIGMALMLLSLAVSIVLLMPIGHEKVRPSDPLIIELPDQQVPLAGGDYKGDGNTTMNPSNGAYGFAVAMAAPSDKSMLETTEGALKGVAVVSDPYKIEAELSSDLGQVTLMSEQFNTPNITGSNAPGVNAGAALGNTTIKYRLLNWVNFPNETPVIMFECNDLLLGSSTPTKLATDTSLIINIPSTTTWDPMAYPIYGYAEGSASNFPINKTQIGTLTVRNVTPALATTAVVTRLHKGDAVSQFNTKLTWWFGQDAADPIISFFVNGTKVSWSYIFEGGYVKYTPASQDLSVGTNVITASIVGGNAYNNAPSASSYVVGTINISELTGSSEIEAAAYSTIHATGTFALNGWQDAMPTASLKVGGYAVSNPVVTIGSDGTGTYTFDYTLPNIAAFKPGADVPIQLTTSGGTAKNSGFANWPIGTIKVKKASPTLIGTNAFSAGKDVSSLKNVLCTTAGMFTGAAPTTCNIILHVLDADGNEIINQRASIAKGNAANIAFPKNFNTFDPGVYAFTAEIEENDNNNGYGPVEIGYVNVNQLSYTFENVYTVYGSGDVFTRTFTLKGWVGEMPEYAIVLDGQTVASGTCVDGNNVVSFSVPRYTIGIFNAYLTISGGAAGNQTYADKGIVRISVSKVVSKARAVSDNQFVMSNKDEDIVRLPVEFAIEGWNADSPEATLDFQYLSEDPENKGTMIPIGTCKIQGNGTYTAYVDVKATGQSRGHQLRVNCSTDKYNAFPWTIVGFVIFKGEPYVEGTYLGDFSIHKGETLPSLPAVNGELKNCLGRKQFWVDVQVCVDGGTLLGKDSSSDTSYAFRIPLNDTPLAALDYGIHQVTLFANANTINYAADPIVISKIYVNGLVPGNNDLTAIKGDTTVRTATFTLPGWCTLPTNATFSLGDVPLSPNDVSLGANSTLRYVIPASMQAGKYALTVTLPDTKTDKGYADAKLGVITITEPVVTPSPKPTQAPVPDPTPSPTPSPTASPTPSPSPKPTSTAKPAATGKPAPAIPAATPGEIVSGMTIQGEDEVEPVPILEVPAFKYVRTIQDDEIPLGAVPVFASVQGLLIDEINPYLCKPLYSHDELVGILNMPTQMAMPLDPNAIDWASQPDGRYALPIIALNETVVGTAWLTPERRDLCDGYIFSLELVPGVISSSDCAAIQIVRCPEELRMADVQSLMAFDRCDTYAFDEWIPKATLSCKKLLYISVPCIFNPADFPTYERDEEQTQQYRELLEVILKENILAVRGALLMAGAIDSVCQSKGAEMPALRTFFALAITHTDHCALLECLSAGCTNAYCPIDGILLPAVVIGVIVNVIRLAAQR